MSLMNSENRIKYLEDTVSNLTVTVNFLMQSLITANKMTASSLENILDQRTSQQRPNDQRYYEQRNVEHRNVEQRNFTNHTKPPRPAYHNKNFNRAAKPFVSEFHHHETQPRDVQSRDVQSRDNYESIINELVNSHNTMTATPVVTTSVVASPVITAEPTPVATEPTPVVKKTTTRKKKTTELTLADVTNAF